VTLARAGIRLYRQDFAYISIPGNGDPDDYRIDTGNALTGTEISLVWLYGTHYHYY
jgi:hypothetical protein